MNGTLTIAFLLIASVAGNIALLNHLHHSEQPASIVQEYSEHSISENEIGRVPALPTEIDLEATLTQRAEELRGHGVPEKLIAAALIPTITRQFSAKIMEHDSLREAAGEAADRRDEWRQLIKAIFGDDFRSRSFAYDPFNRRKKFELTFQFKSDQANEVHRMLGSLGGVNLSQQQKASVVELFQHLEDDREQLFAELEKLFDQQTAEQILLSTDPAFSSAYKRSIALADDLNERARKAKVLYETAVKRTEQLARWDSVEIPDAEKRIGRRTVEKHMLKQLKDELGEPAVELIQSNGW